MITFSKPLTFIDGTRLITHRRIDPRNDVHSEISGFERLFQCHSISFVFKLQNIALGILV